MVSPLLVCLLAVTSPPPATAPTAPTPHVDQVRKSLQDTVKVQLLPNLRTYDALQRDLDKHLQISEDVHVVLRSLDLLRKSEITKWAVDSIPGMHWLGKGWDRLMALSARLVTVRTTLNRVAPLIRSLRDAADVYVNDGSAGQLRTLIRLHRESKRDLGTAHDSLEDLGQLLGKTVVALKGVESVVTPLKETMLVGSLAKMLETRVVRLKAMLGAGQAVVELSTSAMSRDTKLINSLEAEWASAMAHDAYDSAERAATGGRPGTALAAFAHVRHTFPDTPWAHRADQRISELQVELDARAAGPPEASAAVQPVSTTTETSTRPAIVSDRRWMIASAILLGVCLFLMFALARMRSLHARG